MPTQRIDEYFLYHSAGSSPEIKLNCYRSNNWAGSIEFYSGSVPAPSVTGSDGVQLRFPLSRFEEIMTTLRYEKPLYIAVYGDISRIGTRDLEEVGEEES